MAKTTRRSFTAVILVLAMMISIMPAMTPAARAESTSLAGSGNETSPFLIASAEDLAYMRDQVNAGGTITPSGGGDAVAARSARYKLTGNIYLGYWQDDGDGIVEDGELCDSKTGGTAYTTSNWTPIGTNSNNFAGTFDGAGFTVSGVYINNSSDYQGLFGYVGNGTIKNLGVTDSYIIGNNDIGGIAGYNSIQNCYNTGSVSGKEDVGSIAGYSNGTIQNCNNTGSVSGTLYVGGIAGYNNGTIQDCSNMGSVGNGARVGGIVGTVSKYRAVDEGIVKNCNNTGSVSGTQYVGGIAGLIGFNNNGSIQDCYNTGSVSGEGTDNTRVGGIVGSNIRGATQNCYNTGSVSGTSYVGGVIGEYYYGTITGCYYDKQLCTVGGISRNDRTGKAEGKLTSEMTGSALSGVLSSGEWTFTDGLYPRLTGMDATAAAYVSTSPVLLVSSAETAALVKSNFTLGGTGDGVVWTSSDARIVSIAGDTATLKGDGCVVLTATREGFTKSVTLSVERGLSGSGKETDPFKIASADDLAYMRDKVNAGGTIKPSVGGTAVAASSAYYQLTADIVLGYWQDDRDGVVEDGEIYDSETGGTAYTTSNWTPIGTNSNNFAGTFDGAGFTVSGVYINNSSDYQGLFGYVQNGTVKNLGVTDSYTKGRDYVGGIAGYNDGGTIKNCYNTGSVSGSHHVGGIAGYNNTASIQGCYNMGSVSGGSASSNIGGIVGNNDASNVQNCYNTGSVSGSSSIGGISGANDEASGIHSCYNAGSVGGEGNVGGVAGSNSGTVTGCYYDRQMCPVGGMGGTDSKGSAEGKLTSEMTSGAAFTGWGGEWNFTSGLYPRLAGMDATDAAYVSASPIFLAAADTSAGVKSGFTLSIANSVTWASSDDSVISVSGVNGTAERDGTAVLTASRNGAVKNVILTVDITPPTLQNVTRVSDTQITVTLSEPCVNLINSNDGGFTVTKTGTADTFTVTATAQGTDASQIILTVDSIATSAVKGVTVTYTAGGNGQITDLAGNPLATDSAGVTVAPWAPKLATPGSLVWDTSTPAKAIWDAVDNASSYTVQLYKGGTAVGSSVSDITYNYYDFTAAITENGSGTYTFTVQAIGNGTTYADGDMSPQSPDYPYVAPTYTASVNPTDKTFTAAGVGYSAQAAQEFVITNTGTGTITSLGAVLGGSCFEIVSPLPAATLNSGESAAVSVRPVTGLSSGDYTDTLTITADHGISKTVPLSFTVLPPAINPASRNYDLNAPADITATITWYGAASVTNVAYSISPSVTVYTLSSGDYGIDGGDLTIKSSFFEGLSLTAGDLLEFVFTFDTGDTVALTVNVVDGFVPVTTYTVTASAGAGGSITPSGTVVVNEGGSQTFSITANPGYMISAVLVDGINQGAIASYTFTNVTADHTISAEFVPISSGISYTPTAPEKTITVTETSSELFRDAKGAIEAEANMENAFTGSVEVRVTDTREDAASFRLGAGDEVYPFDISIYIKDTNEKTKPAPGNAVTLSLPVPVNLLGVKEQLAVMHKSDSGVVTEISSRLVQKNGVWYIVFEATEFSPYALVVRKTGSYDETNGVPYYLDSDGNMVFIGFAANGKFIAPEGVSVYAARNDKSFTDISGHWAAGHIGFVAEREIFVGTGGGTFSPETGMTRAMFATVIGRLYERSYGEIETTGTKTFTDCDDDAYYGNYIAWASENGIIGGYGNGRFGPDDLITREQMDVILYRFADFLGVLPDSLDTVLNYTDADRISDYAKTAALYCQTTGIIGGRDGGMFAPQETATRAEVATIIQRFVETVLG